MGINCQLESPDGYFTFKSPFFFPCPDHQTCTAFSFKGTLSFCATSVSIASPLCLYLNSQMGLEGLLLVVRCDLIRRTDTMLRVIIVWSVNKIREMIKKKKQQRHNFSFDQLNHCCFFFFFFFRSHVFCNIVHFSLRPVAFTSCVILFPN